LSFSFTTKLPGMLFAPSKVRISPTEAEAGTAKAATMTAEPSRIAVLRIA
jgi:hypothetical protein